MQNFRLARQYARILFFNTNMGKGSTQTFPTIQYQTWVDAFFRIFLARVPTAVTGFNHVNNSRLEIEGPQTEIAV